MSKDPHHVTDFRGGFEQGYTKILGLDDEVENVGMEFGILRLAAGEEFKRQEDGLETQLVLLGGKGTIEIDGERYDVERHDLFRQNGWAFDIATHSSYALVASNEGLEFAVIKAENEKQFGPVVVRPQDVNAEPRGKGQAGGVMLRLVKPYLGDPHIDLDQFRPEESNLVVGEVVNFPGMWSSCPEHSHPHNEVYYYRFNVPDDEPDAIGWGTAQVDREEGPGPYNVNEHDVVKIMNGSGHSQVAGVGYGMWYLWFIRQIDGNRYVGRPPFKFLKPDSWLNKPDAGEKMFKVEDVE